MSATARIALRASLRPHFSARVATNVSRSRLASTHAQSTSTKSGWTPMVSAMIAGGVAIGSLAYMQSPLRMESHAEKSQRKSYYERMQSKGQVGGGASSGKGQDAGEAGGQNESKSKSDQKTSSRGDTTEENAEESAQRRSEAAEGDKQQQQDDARQSVADSSTLPLDELDSEASQESAFDPETNTINWDCPCLGGMAHGPCGDEFKEAFSCFVFSEKEPKGIECVEKFKGMQDCFRKYPEHYKEELEDDEEYEKHDGETLERKGEEHFASHAGGDQEEDDGLKEWRSELAKEGTN